MPVIPHYMFLVYVTNQRNAQLPPGAAPVVASIMATDAPNARAIGANRFGVPIEKVSAELQ